VNWTSREQEKDYYFASIESSFGDYDGGEERGKVDMDE